MRRLASAPVLLSLLLTVPLWLILDNIVVALIAGLLLAFLAAMVHSLLILKTQAMPDNTDTPRTAHTAVQQSDTPEHQPDILRLPPLPIPSGLPQPDAAALAHSHALQAHLAREIHASTQGFLPFDQWMHHTLYAPGLGYYAARTAKLGDAGQGGDFTTAPELTPLFGQTLATQVAQILHESGSMHVLEFGAGSGALAQALIPALQAQGIRPHYSILEVSEDLRQRQKARLAGLDARIQWLDTLPAGFIGCVIANEVLDAMPAQLFRWDAQGTLMELGVCGEPPFTLAQRPAPQALRDAVAACMPPLPGYQSEIGLQGRAWVRGMGDWLVKGAALLIDYGFPRHEFYHPQRAEGTLMCHFRHHAHGNPLIHPGLQDITTHVDFTAVADAALEGGLEVLGYTSQARFLMNAGLMARLTDTTDTAASAPADAPPADAAACAAQAARLSAVQKLLSEAEMGELFKVMAIGKGIESPLLGFAQGDRRHRL